MQIPPFPENKSARRKALYESSILDSPPDERFDRLTRLAHLRRVIALVSLVDAQRQPRQQHVPALGPGKISGSGNLILC